MQRRGEPTSSSAAAGCVRQVLDEQRVGAALHRRLCRRRQPAEASSLDTSTPAVARSRLVAAMTCVSPSAMRTARSAADGSSSSACTPGR